MKEIRCPALVRCEAKNRLNVKSARIIAHHIAGTKLQVIVNIGHVVNKEKTNYWWSG